MIILFIHCMVFKVRFTMIVTVLCKPHVLLNIKMRNNVICCILDHFTLKVLVLVLTPLLLSNNCANKRVFLGFCLHLKAVYYQIRLTLTPASGHEMNLCPSDTNHVYVQTVIITAAIHRFVAYLLSRYLT